MKQVFDKSVEEKDVGTPKDYAQQILAAFKNLEHGVTDFHGQGVMEAGEEDMIYDIICNALNKYRLSLIDAEIERWNKIIEEIEGFTAFYMPATDGEEPTRSGFKTEEDAWSWIKSNHLCKKDCDMCLAEWDVSKSEIDEGKKHLATDHLTHLKEQKEIISNQ